MAELNYPEKKLGKIGGGAVPPGPNVEPPLLRMRAGVRPKYNILLVVLCF